MIFTSMKFKEKEREMIFHLFLNFLLTIMKIRHIFIEQTTQGGAVGSSSGS
jgi:hypothetical protein